MGSFPGCPAPGRFVAPSIFSSSAQGCKICVVKYSDKIMAEPEKKFPGLLHPLSMMRRTRGLPNLEYQVIESTDLPEPYRQLLAHEGDMTSRLESAYRASIRVNNGCMLNWQAVKTAGVLKRVLHVRALSRITWL